MNLANLKDTIIIGTAQLGSHYGIANKKNKIIIKDKIELLNLCYQNNLCNYDTAYAYKNSHKIIGKWIKKYSVDPKINTKIPSLNKDSLNDIKSYFYKSLKELNTLNVNILFLHNSIDWKKKEVKKFIKSITNKKLINKFGLSIYDEKDFIKDAQIKTIQVPGNIFNQKLLLSEEINEFINNNGEVQIRSILIQGLLTLDIKSLPANIKETAKGLLYFKNTAKELNINKIHLAILCVNHLLPKAKIIIGIDSDIQIRELLDIQRAKVKKSDIIEILKICKSFEGNHWDPRNW